ncbi:MAG: hypothetical protein HY300_15190 [Verrucomicrobia bacterium]|nr:hypothetical protein [Verrucomicrobiota bacterium]
MNCRNILPLVFGVLLSTTAAAHADIEEVWRQRADAGVLAVPDGTNAVYVLYQADFAEGFAFPVVDRTISGVTFTTNNATRVFYLARYDGAGALQWIQPIGKGPRSPFGGDAGPFSGIRRMRMDSNHNLFICGNIIGSSTPTLIGTNQFTAPNYYGLPFVAKMDSSGNVLWAKVVTGSDAAGFDGLAVDGNGDAFVCGQLYGTQTFGSITVANGGGNRPFIAKINGAGNWV